MQYSFRLFSFIYLNAIKQQAIIWASDDLDPSHSMASLGHVELNEIQWPIFSVLLCSLTHKHLSRPVV